MCCEGLSYLNRLLSNVRVVSGLSPAIAVIPFFGFILGIWGIIGCGLYYFIDYVKLLLAVDVTVIFSVQFFITSTLAIIVYSVLPSVLWYAFPMKGEKEASYPRLDTSGHVIKYYLISVVTLAFYMGISALNFAPVDSKEYILEIMAWYAQYLDAVLIIGIPLLILISVIRNRTITINERMVLAFLIIGVLASALGGYLLYRNTLQLAPEIFEEYEALSDVEADVWTSEMEEVFVRYSRFWNWFFVMMAVMLNGLLAVEILFMRSIEKKVTRPIIHLTDVLADYSDQEEGGFDPGGSSGAVQAIPERLRRDQ